VLGGAVNPSYSRGCPQTSRCGVKPLRLASGQRRVTLLRGLAFLIGVNLTYELSRTRRLPSHVE